MKKIISLILGAVLSLSFTGCGASNGSSSSTSNSASGSGDTIELGIISPSIGELSVYGQSVNNAMALAIEEINSKGGVLGKQLHATYLDDKHDTAEAVNCYNKLAGQGVSAIIGSVASADTSAIASVASKDNKLLLTPTSTNDDITKLGKCIFRACYTDSHQGEIMAKFASEKLNAKKSRNSLQHY